MIKVDFKQLEKYADKLKKLDTRAMSNFSEETLKELSERYLRKVIMRTPVMTGNLRRGWTVGEITKTENGYAIGIINNVEYAPYVEFGHRTRNGGWVAGQLFMTNSEAELERELPQILESKLEKFLRGYFE
jgi:predicted GTPase